MARVEKEEEEDQNAEYYVTKFHKGSQYVLLILQAQDLMDILVFLLAKNVIQILRLNRPVY